MQNNACRKNFATPSRLLKIFYILMHFFSCFLVTVFRVLVFVIQDPLNMNLTTSFISTSNYLLTSNLISNVDCFRRNDKKE